MTLWDLAIWCAGIIYIALVLVINLDSPLFGLVLIGLAAWELAAPRWLRKKSIGHR